MLAQKGNYLFPIEIKDRPIETFDIIRSETISTNLAHIKGLKPQCVVGVVASGSAIPMEARTFGKERGVILTDTRNLSDSMELVVKDSSHKTRPRKRT